MKPATTALRVRFAFISILLTAMLAVPHRAEGQTNAYTVTPVTSGALDHKWPSINGSGDIVWSQQVGGFWQVYLLAHGSSTAVAVSGQQSNHNNEFPDVDDAGNVMYLKDGVGAGPGLVVVRNSGG